MAKSKGSVHFSSKSYEWETPQDLFNKLWEEFHLNLDVCASRKNAKCPKYFSIQDDGLSQSWIGWRCWMNPPYGRDIKKWIQKAYETAKYTDGLVVCLIPSRTDTSYWHDYVMKANEIRYIRGRLKFNGSKWNAPFPAAIVIFGKLSLANGYMNG